MLAPNAYNLAESLLTFTRYDSINDLIEDTSGERHIRAVSQNAWVWVDDAKYVLAARGGVLTLEKAKLDTFRISITFCISPTGSDCGSSNEKS
jgi:ATP-dependent helicase IRC3